MMANPLPSHSHSHSQPPPPPIPPPQTQPAPLDSESQTSPFSCNICHKTYTRVDHLARHVRSHTQEKPFSCHVCGKSFARADLLKRHSANHEDTPDGRKRRRLNQPQSRVAQACIACAASKLRCSGDEPCKRCAQKNLECRYGKPRTSIIPEDGMSQDHIESASVTPQDDWSRSSVPAHGMVISPHYVHQQSSSPGQMRSVPDGMHGPVRLPMIQPPTQLPTPSSSGQPIDITAFPESMYEVGQGMDHIESSFADFLRDVMMPDPTNAEPAPHNLNLGRSFQSFDLLNLAGSQPTKAPHDNNDAYLQPEAQEQQNDMKSETHHPVYSNSGQATPSGATGIRLGAQAFKDSIWLYAPSQNHHVGADQNNMFLPLENLITKTRCRGPPPCENLAPALRDRILATVLAESSNAIVPDVLSSFPSAELLTNLIHRFLLRHERNDDAWIHTPTFDPNQQHPEFLMSVIAGGAVISELPQIRNLGFAFQEAARRSVTEQIERDNRAIRHLRPLQTYALHLDIGMWSGDRRRMELSESHSFILVTMMRRGDFFRQSPQRSPAPEIGDSSEVIENKWKLWVERESFKRLAFHLLIRDAQTSISLITPPMVSPSEMMVELPASSDMWHAKSSTEWKNLYLAKHISQRGSIPTLRGATDDFSLVSSYLDIIDIPLTNLLVLCNLWSLSWQYRELIRLNVSNPGGNSSLITKSLYQEIIQALQRFRLYSSDWMSGIQPLAVILHERVLLNLHASLEDVQLFAGKAGEDEARRAYPVLAAWAQSRESRQAVCYAGQIIKAAKEFPRQMLQDFAAVSVYHASLIFWAYSIISSHSTPVLPMSPRDNQQIVFVDGDDTPHVQRFIVLGKGCPALNASSSPNEQRIVPISDARAIMHAITDLLKRNNALDGGKDDELSPLVSNLSKLMRSLGNAARGIRSTGSSNQSTTA